MATAAIGRIGRRIHLFNIGDDQLLHQRRIQERHLGNIGNAKHGHESTLLFFWHVVVGVYHIERLQNMFLKQTLHCSTRCLFTHMREHVGADTVSELRPWLERRAAESLTLPSFRLTNIARQPRYPLRHTQGQYGNLQ